MACNALIGQINAQEIYDEQFYTYNEIAPIWEMLHQKGTVHLKKEAGEPLTAYTEEDKIVTQNDNGKWSSEKNAPVADVHNIQVGSQAFEVVQELAINDTTQLVLTSKDAYLSTDAGSSWSAIEGNFNPIEQVCRIGTAEIFAVS